MARNAGLTDYRAFIWKSFKRFDYTPEDCLGFARGHRPRLRTGGPRAGPPARGDDLPS